MEKIIEIAKQNYILFIIISCVLVLSLIGYIVDLKTGADYKIKNRERKLKSTLEPDKNKETEKTEIERL